MLDKLKFWKKDDDLRFEDSSLSKEPGLSSDPAQQPHDFNPSDPMSSPIPQTAALGQQPFAATPGQQPFSSPAPFPQQQPANDSRELELVVAKLDALKVTLESINQRLTTLERIAQQSDDSYDEYRKRTW